jgi:hypothetical protein
MTHSKDLHQSAVQILLRYCDDPWLALNRQSLCEMAGVSCGADLVLALQGCYAVYVRSSLPTFREVSHKLSRVNKLGL